MVDEPVSCDAVSNQNYFVDPVNGNDTFGNGSNSPSPACAFMTITRALHVIGSTPPAGTKVTVLGPSSVSSGEVFPFILPPGVLLTSQGGAVTVVVPTSQIGFELQDGCGIQSGAGAVITIDGQSSAATYGVWAFGGGMFLDTVTIRNFYANGIIMSGGVLSIRKGVTSTGNHGNSRTAAGLNVGDGQAIVNVPTGEATTAFTNNDYGITVTGNGFLTLVGTPSAVPDGTGTVVASGNVVAGVSIQQALTVPVTSLNDIDGLVSWGSAGIGFGLDIFAGARLRLRNSTILANPGAGIVLQMNGTSVDVSNVDLGTATSFGRNTLQASAGSHPNAVGICIELPPTAAQILYARGNIFSGARDCATGTPGQLTIADSCQGGVDLGIQQLATSTNDIDVANCTHP